MLGIAVGYAVLTAIMKEVLHSPIRMVVVNVASFLSVDRRNFGIPLRIQFSE